jgi:hypothetical protein
MQVPQLHVMTFTGVMKTYFHANPLPVRSFIPRWSTFCFFVRSACPDLFLYPSPSLFDFSRMTNFDTDEDFEWHCLLRPIFYRVLIHLWYFSLIRNASLRFAAADALHWIPYVCWRLFRAHLRTHVLGRFECELY